MRWVCATGLLGILLTIAPDSNAQSVALLLFGGTDHKTFLGCLNCNRFDTGSICNRFGEAGSKFNTNSIWNRFGEFGSKFSTVSPWNRFSTDAPVIVDNSGTFYGYFTANKYLSGRTQIAALNQLADLVAEIGDPDKARDLYCGT